MNVCSDFTGTRAGMSEMSVLDVFLMEFCPTSEGFESSGKIAQEI